jgi:hypothetical protein
MGKACYHLAHAYSLIFRIWASHWYQSVHQSVGLQRKDLNGNIKYGACSANELEVFRECLPFYNLLKMHAVGVDAMARGILSSPGASSIPLNVEGSSSGFSDPRNADILVWIGNSLVPREYAKISVFDSAVQGGDAVWEGIRVYGNRVFKMNEHIERLFDSGKAMGFSNMPSKQYISNAIFATLKGKFIHMHLILKSDFFFVANGMVGSEIVGGVHMRLTLTRGTKVSSSMNPKFNLYGTTRE